MKRDEHKALATGESVDLASQSNYVVLTESTTLTAGDSGKILG